MRQISAEQKWLKRLEGVGKQFERVDAEMGCAALEGGVLTSIRILTTGSGRGDVLIVLKARVGLDHWVGFVGGPDVVTALLTWKKKEDGQGVRYRPEVPWAER